MSCSREELDGLLEEYLVAIDVDPPANNTENVPSREVKTLERPALVAIYQFGCGYGGPWGGLMDVEKHEALSLLAGENTVTKNAILHYRASTEVNGALYTLLIYGQRPGRGDSLDQGNLDVKGFRKFLSKYRGSGKSGVDKLIVRQRGGKPVGFDEDGISDPFLGLLGLP